MRKLFSLLSVALVVLFAVGCETVPDSPSNDNTGVTFTFQNAKATTSSIEVQVVPSDVDVNYFASIVEKVTLADLDEATIVDSMLNSNDFKVRKGPQYVAANNLKPGTAYVVVAFAITEMKLARYDVATEASVDPVPSTQFDVEIEIKDITATSATAIAKPNTTANRYYFRVITKMELDAFGIYNNDYQIFEYIIENPHSGEYVVSGDQTLECSLNPEMDFLAVAFNFENWEAVHNQEEPIKLFRKEFTTPAAPPVDPNSLFTYANLKTTSYGFSVDVTPTKGEESFWTYYVWTKKSYEETLADESSNNIVMRSYWALNNLGQDAFIYDFGEFMEDYMGQVGTTNIINYEPLKGNSEYVIVLFYMDPEVSDPTEVYDYNYVAIDIKTKERTLPAAKLEVSEAVVTKSGFKYNVQFLVKVDDAATNMKVGAQLWSGYDFDSYWNPNDWSQIEAFFEFGTYVSEDTLAAAKTADGATVAFNDVDKGDYAFFFEVYNEEYTKTQFGVRVTPEMFENAQ